MHLFVIRHGECLGQCDPSEYANPDSWLSSLGKEQAQRVGERLKMEGISRLLSSPLVRALETAQIIGRACDARPVEVWPELREGYSGYHRGRGRHELLEHFPETRLPATIDETGWDHGNDSYEPFCNRARAILHRLQREFHPDDRVVIVTHGGIANYLIHAMLGMDTAQPCWFELANGGITHFRFVPDPAAERPDWPLYPPVKVEIHAINNTTHLSNVVQ